MYGRLHSILSWISENLSTIGAIVGGIIVAGLLVLFIALSMIAHAEWVAWCEDQGGRVIDDTDTQLGTGVDANGNVIVTTTSNTDYYCLNENGGIIDIR